MTRKFNMLSCVALLTFLQGCQQESNQPVSTTETGQPGALIAPVLDLNSTTAGKVKADATVQEVVSEFLQALRQGDADAVTRLLTDKARVETEKHQLAVQPPGTAAAQYQVGKVEMVDGGAYVNSTWLEPDVDGKQQRYEIVWVLRSQANGWRVAGMAARIDPKRELTYLNFEDPQDMLNKWEAVDTELASRLMDPSAPRVSERPQPSTPR
ncbi:MAG: hypothetical protein ABGX05_14935 [Pirellulaceae bacterium]